MGVNLGDVIAEGDTIYGNGVNVAARLEKLAEPGGVCIDSSVYDQIKSKVPYGFRDLGEQKLHSIPNPVRAYQVTMGPSQERPAQQGSNSGMQERTSIAVLPLTCMSDDRDQEYFADGLTEDLITALADNGSLSVVARNSTFAYKGKSVKVQDLGRDLGADFVIEGSVRQAGNRVRITVQLIDCQTGAHAWTKKFDQIGRASCRERV